VLVVGGSRYTPGAVLLAGVAALRAGAGRLQLAVTVTTAPALSIAVPEAKVMGLPETDDGSVSGDVPDQLLELAAAADVIAIGPGLDNVEETAKPLRGSSTQPAGAPRSCSTRTPLAHSAPTPISWSAAHSGSC
jgi:ADP-dependent NAD(P)H-hydrate dehydratase